MKSWMIRYIVLLCFSSTLLGQELSPVIVAPQGGIDKSENYLLAWTLGESNIETVYQSDKIYTQGFHQPVLEILSEDLTTEGENPIIDVELSPNPVESALNVKIKANSSESYNLIFIDSNGQVFKQIQSPVNISNFRIAVSDLPSGIYLLQISDRDDSIVGTYKILKI